MELCQGICDAYLPIEAVITMNEKTGCKLRRRTEDGCALMDCPDSGRFMCEITPPELPDFETWNHDEMDEAADAFWQQAPIPGNTVYPGMTESACG